MAGRRREQQTLCRFHGLPARAGAFQGQCAAHHDPPEQHVPFFIKNFYGMATFKMLIFSVTCTLLRVCGHPWAVGAREGGPVASTAGGCCCSLVWQTWSSRYSDILHSTLKCRFKVCNITGQDSKSSRKKPARCDESSGSGGQDRRERVLSAGVCLKVKLH